MPDRRPRNRLAVERVRAGWGLKALADAVDVDRSTVYRLEVGLIMKPRPETRRRLAEVLKVTEADLFDGKVGK